eukprot:CAMPEP_0173456188 /NCGR_PEP_ID=MMETSP1357-20121228/55608_1 /TAXON_ID=77926 /ORGANISM="Hemiselmis rufescens, Strain PCC563" /LENGTH=35 /DNA_ID= /DNA_START= /DNA_END= /DNA_ORIENTATION=
MPEKAQRKCAFAGPSGTPAAAGPGALTLQHHAMQA